MKRAVPAIGAIAIVIILIATFLFAGYAIGIESTAVQACDKLGMITVNAVDGNPLTADYRCVPGLEP